MKIYGFEGKCNTSGERVKMAREHLGISQSQLAARLQVEGIQLNQKAISRIETGDRVIADYELIFLSKSLKVDLVWLLMGDQTKK
ncbi:MAG: helix-turn-helix transcriptional regulator [Eubacteriales bacterium]|nr:helix-turn-helix transcriptional regulator [Eubacteriales bacterium]